jgi:DNA-binding MarR family transcriptional regulator
MNIAVAEKDWLMEEAARLAALPTFPAAVREYALGLAHFRRSPRFVNKLISHDSRWRVVGYLLYLHAEGGATYGRLLDLCTRRQEVSPRVLKTILALLQFTGFVHVRRCSADRRLKFYAPTERMDAFVRQWLGYGVNALDILEPEMQRARMLREDPDFIGRFLASGGRDYLTSTPPADRMPDFIAFFGSREGAAAATLAVMLADFDRQPAPSRAEIARTFGLSKTQVANVLAAGEAIGYFAPDEAGVPAATPHLRDTFGAWISIELAFYARNMRPAPVCRA